MAGVPSPDGRPCTDCAFPASFNFTRLGVRVPMIIASPWALPVTPPPPSAGAYEHSSLAATLAQLLPAAFPAPLTARAAWAAPLTALWEATDLPGPRTDTPAVLPPVPTTPSPSMAGVSREGKGPLNHLQVSLLALAEAAAAEAEGGGAQHAGAVAARLAGIRTEAEAGLFARARLGALLGRGAGEKQ